MKDEPVNIQKEIEEILTTEFRRLLEENADNPLFQLIISGALDPGSEINLDDVRRKVLGE